nr:hypothetical protein [uncultured Psychroserpens sp.]
MKHIRNIIGFTIVIPIIIVVIIIISPFIIYAIISGGVKKYKDRKKLKELLYSNNGQIYFISAYYNLYDLSKVIREKYQEIICIRIEKDSKPDILTEYLIKECGNHSYPRLIKIENNRLVHKVHYNSFKNLYKRKNDIEAFLDLIEKSIHNLKN